MGCWTRRVWLSLEGQSPLLVCAVIETHRARCHLTCQGRFRIRRTTNVDLGIDSIDPPYYTVADGDGQTTAAREADVDVGSDQRPTA
jgi:hypothetical protein